MNRHLRWTALAQLLPRVALAFWLAAAPTLARAEVFRYQPRGKAYVPKESVPCDAAVNCTTPINCATPCPTCAGNDPNCACQRRCEPCQRRCEPCQNCKQPCKPPCKPPEQPLYVQPGMFVQPPANGTVRGPVNQYGLEGGEITLPALSLRLPSIRLPGVSHSRQNARMETDVAMAPYVELPAQPVYPQQPVAAAPVEPVAAAPAPAMQMMAMPPQMMMAPPMMMAPMQMPMMAPPAYAPPPVQAPPPPVAAPPQPPPDLPTPCPPSCDARGVPTAALNAEQKIRQLEIAEQQLQARLEQLRRQLEQAEASQRPPVPTPDLGARQLQQPLQTPGVHPVSRPLAPLPPQAAPQPTKLYNERPASFVTEPQLLPQSVAQPIREPQASAARITGLRPR